ncbi:MAG: amidohydrolase family protein [Gammaproteobacteria bacterium]
MMARVIRVLCAAGIAIVWSAAPADDVLVVKGGMLIDPARPDLGGRATLVIENGRIRASGAADELEWPENARVIEAAGRYVMPGIADMHNHLRSGLFRPGHDQAGVLRSLLDWGVTTTFDPGVPAGEFGQLRRSIADDPGAYPRAFLIRGVFTAAGGWGKGYQPTTVAAARAIVRELRQVGSDGVKLMYDDMRWATTRPFVVMEREIAAAIIDEAHRQGMMAFAHAPILELAKQVLEDGVDCLLHGIISEPVDAEFIELMKRNGACYVSTLAMFQTNAGYGRWADRLAAFDLGDRLDTQALAIFHKVPPGTARLDNTAWAAERLPVLRLNLFTVTNAGIALMIGTDTGIPGVLPGRAAQLELDMPAAAGLPPAHDLTAATATAATVMGRTGEFGTLAVGAQADLLVLDADPREDIGNIRLIRHVIRAGRIVE